MIDVTCAVIRNDEGLVLAVRRGPEQDNPGKWEFPGGKTNPGEDFEDCILREIKEELNIDIIIADRLDYVEYDYGDKIIRLIPFVCDTLASVPHLTDHDEYSWVKPELLVTLDLTPPDVPVARQYVASFSLQQVNEHAGEANAPASHLSDSVEGEDAEMSKVMSMITTTNEISMMSRSAVNDNMLLTQLLRLSLSSEKRVGFISSWVLSKVADIDPAVFHPFLATIIDSLPDVPNDSVQRSFMRIIVKCDAGAIPVSHHSQLIDYCMNILRSEQKAVAPKAYSMEIMAAMAVIYPDLGNELAAVIQIVMNDASPAIKAQGRKVISIMKKK